MALPQSSDDSTLSNTRLAQIALNGLLLKSEGEGHKVGRMYWDEGGSGSS